MDANKNSGGTRAKGARYLEAVDRGHFTDVPLPGYPDKTGADFLSVCGSPTQLADPNFVPHAEYQFEGFLATSPSDPDYELVKRDLQNIIDGFMKAANIAA